MSPAIARFLRKFQRHKGAVIGAALLVTMVLSALLAPVIAPYDPTEQQQDASLARPGKDHPLGTDVLGRDVLSRLLWGGRQSLRVGLLAVAIGAIVGTALGMLAGFYEGWIGNAIMRSVDLLLALPGILLALTIVAAIGPSLENLIIAVGISTIPGYVRVVNGSVLSLKTRSYLEAVRALGARDARLIVRHVLPNIMAPVLVLSTLGLGNAILVAASLSFLGLGVQPPTPEWGAMLSQGREFIYGYWWIATFPGIAILLSVIAINLLGEGLRDLLDPRLRI